MVDDPTHDGDTTYVESSTSGHKDRYAFTPGLSAVSIKAVIPWTVATGGGSLRHVLTGTAGTEEDNGADIVTDASAYNSQESVWETDPDTGVPWTAAGLDDADFTLGQKVA